MGRSGRVCAMVENRCACARSAHDLRVCDILGHKTRVTCMGRMGFGRECENHKNAEFNPGIWGQGVCHIWEKWVPRLVLNRLVSLSNRAIVFIRDEAGYA